VSSLFLSALVELHVVLSTAEALCPPLRAGDALAAQVRYDEAAHFCTRERSARVSLPTHHRITSSQLQQAVSEARESLDEDNAAAANAAEVRAVSGSGAVGSDDAETLLGEAPARERKREREGGSDAGGSGSADTEIGADTACTADGDADAKVSAPATDVMGSVEGATVAFAGTEAEPGLSQRLPLRDAPWRLVEAGLGFSPQVS
jgi:hypothetical protein